MYTVEELREALRHLDNKFKAAKKTVAEYDRLFVKHKRNKVKPL